ncbi:urea transporter [Pseudonocardia hydrocarbonoxydans]|uniref:Urea transporter n=1 Tax=Pseudonocardia hydrocarbonoxydans TaxID=76726 RepID=A0A4Y3WP13_9PSEU|nr:urea transporter [Pseudonocardia hydrocarbonoxydans]GEC19780.1 urea transporter [Pseudonocardia hydrocarbonoxydans]
MSGGWIDGTAPQLQERLERVPPLAFVESCLRGVGQVMFMNNPLTGLLVLLAAWIHDPWLGFGGTLGVAVSTLVAILMGFDRGAVRLGLFGFNGVLCGLALATFLAPAWDGVSVVWIVVVSAGSSVAMAALAALFGIWGVPPFTLAFNISVLLFLVTGLNVARGNLGELVSPASPTVAGPSVSTVLRESADAAGSTDAFAVLNAVFRGIAQLFFVNSILGGVIILVGIAVCSRIAALFAVAGSAVGMLVGMALGADGVAIYNGLWGFNSYDACLAIAGVFYVLSWRSALLGLACAAYTALLFGAIASFLSPWGLPAMTLPFCFGVLTFVMLRDAAPHRFTWVPPAEITTPEEHLRRARATVTS